MYIRNDAGIHNVLAALGHPSLHGGAHCRNLAGEEDIVFARTAGLCEYKAHICSLKEDIGCLHPSGYTVKLKKTNCIVHIVIPLQ